MVRAAEGVARERGYAALGLCTNKRMVRNVAPDGRAGYVVTGARPHPSREGETLLDMTRRLA